MTSKITDPHWELTILDADPPGKMEQGCGSCIAGDADGDGRVELFIGCPEAITWYRPGSADRGVVVAGKTTHVGLALADITGDGRLELACHLRDAETEEGPIAWLEMPADGIDGEWMAHVIDPEPTGGGHDVIFADVDGDGELEVVGKEWRISKVHWYDRVDEPSPIARFEHAFVDRDKGEVGIDITATDVDGDGMNDIVCASWWYKNPGWEKFAIPGIAQVINAYDIDGDGRDELIATKRNGDKTGYGGLTPELVWLKPVDPVSGEWEEHAIGRGIGDWPHGSCVAPVLPGGRPALMTSYHSAHASKEQEVPHFPEIWEVPDDPTEPWPKRPLAEILYGEEMVAHDFTGDGTLDLQCGPWNLINQGDGTFRPVRIVEDDAFYPARVAVMDVNGNGLSDVVMGQEKMDYPTKQVPWSPLAWFENPGPGAEGPWKMHVIDTVRCAHSIGVADLDGDGELEIVAGEHYPFYPFRSRCKTFAYKKADPAGLTWKRWTLDDRFEHHDGTKIIELAPGRIGIMSHVWQEAKYVHLWTRRG